MLKAMVSCGADDTARYAIMRRELYFRVKKSTRIFEDGPFVMLHHVCSAIDVLMICILL